MADGSELSHALALVHDAAGLARLACGDVPGLQLPCVLQEFVDHGGSIFKVYVVGDAVTTTRRRSLPNQHTRAARSSDGGDAAGGALPPPQPSGLEVVERISTLGAHWREQQLLSPHAPLPLPTGLACSPPGYHIEGAAAVQEPSGVFVRALALALKASLGLQLFNFDLIRVAAERDRFLVVDINYFPGIAKMPGYEAVFADFLRRSVDEGRARRAAPPEAAPPPALPPLPQSPPQSPRAPQAAPLCACGSD
jgi:inositol-1,3,4-trisphosphate 5/6-kinase/inositol-tetrakisphosphate 1-kinase